MTCCGTSSTTIQHTAVLRSLAITPADASLTVGQSQQFAATGSYSDGTTRDLSSAVAWSSSNSSAVAVSTSGLATVVGPGTATVSADAAAGLGSASTTVTATYAGMLIYHNDLARTGQNLNETILTPANVNSSQFGKLFAYPVDGATYTQPLYVQSVTIPGQGVHNVVYVATENDSVYAFDADGKVSAPLWQVSFLNASGSVTTIRPPDAHVFPGGQIGITGTPAIDPATGTLYVVACTLENGQTVYRLHALDLSSGAEKLGGPVVISATVPGTGDGTDGQGHVTFDPVQHLQRQALLLLNGTIYVGFASHADKRPYHGWVFAYDATTLKQTAVLNDTPNGAQGGIWEAGAAPAVDADGNIYVATGNGTFDVTRGGLDYGDSLLKLDASLGVLDYFTPFNQSDLDARDSDLGSGGQVLLPDQPGAHPHLLVMAGKEGRIYVLDRDNLGGYSVRSDAQAVQESTGQLTVNVCTPAYWQGNLYFVADHDKLKMFALTGGSISASPAASSSNSYGRNGATVSVSANGSVDGIVWAVNTSAAQSGGAVQLYAYDATNVSHELYDSTQAGSRDTPGTATKFVVPTVISGKVYVATATELDVFGLLSSQANAGLNAHWSPGLLLSVVNAFSETKVILVILSAICAGTIFVLLASRLLRSR